MNFRSHLQRKTKCEPLFEDVDTETLLSELDEVLHFSCDVCKKFFPTQHNLQRHFRRSHADTYNKNKHTDFQNNKILNIFGREYLDHLDDNFLEKCVSGLSHSGLENLIQIIWCNPNIPQNRNILVKRQRKPRILYIYTENPIDGTHYWVEKHGNDILEDMIRKTANILHLYVNRVHEEKKNPTRECVNILDECRNKIVKFITKERGFGKKMDSVFILLNQFNRK